MDIVPADPVKSAIFRLGIVFSIIFGLSSFFLLDMADTVSTAVRSHSTLSKHPDYLKGIEECRTTDKLDREMSLTLRRALTRTGFSRVTKDGSVFDEDGLFHGGRTLVGQLPSVIDYCRLAFGIYVDADRDRTSSSLKFLAWLVLSALIPFLLLMLHSIFRWVVGPIRNRPD